MYSVNYMVHLDTYAISITVHIKQSYDCTLLCFVEIIFRVDSPTKLSVIGSFVLFGVRTKQILLPSEFT